MSTTPDLLELVEQGLLEDSFLEQTLELVPQLAEEKELLHAPSCYRLPGRVKTTHVKLSLREISTLDLCYCVWRDAPTHIPALRDIDVLTKLLVDSRSAARSKLSRSSQESVKKKLDNLNSLLVPAARVSDPALLTLKDAALEQGKNVVALLGKTLRSPAAQAASLALASKELKQGFSMTLDRSMIAVALYHFRPARKLSALIEPFEVFSRGPIRVLHCPRFFYDYVQREAYRSQGAWKFACAYQEDSESHVMTAAALWTPEDRSAPYSDFFESLEAARAL